MLKININKYINMYLDLVRASIFIHESHLLFFLIPLSFDVIS